MLDGKKVRREYININTVDDIDRMRTELLASITANGDDPAILEEDEDTFAFAGYNNYIYKPKARNGVGLFQTRSKDYTFLLDGETEKSYGNIPAVDSMEILENGFINVQGRTAHGEIIGIKYTLASGDGV
jgi:hypothetical protein